MKEDERIEKAKITAWRNAFRWSEHQVLFYKRKLKERNACITKHNNTTTQDQVLTRCSEDCLLSNYPIHKARLAEAGTPWSVNRILQPRTRSSIHGRGKKRLLYSKISRPTLGLTQQESEGKSLTSI